jgi:hypothetical protein
LFEIADETTHRLDDLRVVMRRRGDAPARQLVAGGIDRERLDLGAAEIDADADRGGRVGDRHRESG